MDELLTERHREFPSARFSAVVYFTKPTLPFEKIEATLWVRGTFRLPPDSSSGKFECGMKEHRKDIAWGELSEPKKGDGKYQLTVTDIFCRLEKAELKLFDARGKASAAKVEVESAPRRSIWRIDTAGGKDTPAKFEIIVPGPVFYVEKAIKVTVPRPPG